MNNKLNNQIKLKSLKKLPLKYSSAKKWFVYDAAYLLRGFEPVHHKRGFDGSFSKKDEKYMKEIEELKTILITAVSDGALEGTSNNSRGKFFPESMKVEVEELANWVFRNKIPIPTIISIFFEKFNKNSHDKSSSQISLHGNAERYAQTREKVLEAALKAVTNFTEKCKKNKRFNGAVILKTIEQDEELKRMVINEDGDWVMNHDGMTRLINKNIKLGD